MDIIKIFSLFLCLTTFAVGSKIIVMLPVASTSHKNVFTPVVEELASRGHQVTFITPIKPKKETSNVKEITLPQAMAPFMEKIQKSIFGQPKSSGPFDAITEIGGMRNVIAQSCEDLFNDATVKNLLKEGKQFDVALVSEFFNDCALSTAYVLAKHVIHFSTGPQLPWLTTQVPSPPSYVPNPMFTFTERMTFFERLQNSLSLAAIQILYPLFIQPVSQELLTKYVPEAPTLDEAYRNVAFTILNMDPFYHTPRPSMPNVVNIGAGHCRPGKPVPKEFTDFINTSGEDGFIIFGLGSVAKSQYIPSHVKEAFLSAFKRLKQKVIWKHEVDLPNLPENVKITKWMPQQDLLAHPKIRLFMTHGGLLSLEEALYHAVPVIGIPLFADQAGNVALAKRRGVGESLDDKNITAEGVYEVISKVLNDPSYKENMKKYSGILRDQPERPVERAVFWIEYVIRHDGARHFRSAGADLNFFQYFLLDVAAFLLVLVAAATAVVVLLAKTILRRFCKCSKKQQTSNKKDN